MLPVDKRPLAHSPAPLPKPTAPFIGREGTGRDLATAGLADGSEPVPVMKENAAAEPPKALASYSAKCVIPEYDDRRLLWVVASGNVEGIKQLLSPHPLPLVAQYLNRCGVESYTPLMLAARHGNREVAQALIDFGAKINAADARGVTVLMFAAMRGPEGIISVFLDALKTPEAINAAIHAKDACGISALMYAASNGHAETVRELLDALGSTEARLSAIASAANDGTTALMFAAMHGRTAVVRVLLTHTKLAKPEVISAARQDGATALILAVEKGYSDVSDLLSQVLSETMGKMRPEEWAIA